MAERRGFEPLIQMNRITVFETAAFDRSAISPQKQDYNLACEHEKIKDEPQKNLFFFIAAGLERQRFSPAAPPLSAKRRFVFSSGHAHFGRHSSDSRQRGVRLPSMTRRRRLGKIARDLCLSRARCKA